LARGFFDACIVAGILAVVIELFSAKRLIERVSHHLAGRLVGRHLPRALQETVSDLVVETGLVLHNYVKAYRFSEFGSEGHLGIEMTTSYEVLNYSDRSIDYAPHLAEEIFYDPHFLCLEYSVGSRAHAFGQDVLMPLVQQDNDSRVKKVTGPKKLKIRPAKDSPDAPDTCRVLWRHTVRMPSEYSDVTAFGAPTIGVSLRVDSKPEGLDFFAGGPGMEHVEGSSTWNSARSFITNQHVRAWWFRRK
jgi:hypothetical protein